MQREITISYIDIAAGEKWRAIRGDEDLDIIVGWGKTERLALEDLLEQEMNNDEEN